jgi:hypothetical protein
VYAYPGLECAGSARYVVSCTEGASCDVEAYGGAGELLGDFVDVEALHVWEAVEVSDFVLLLLFVERSVADDF